MNPTGGPARIECLIQVEALAAIEGRIGPCRSQHVFCFT